MSHITTVEMEIRDLGCLREACESLGLELELERKEYKTYRGSTAACSHVIRLPNRPMAYEIGVLSAGKGVYTLGYDGWNGGCGMMAVVGDNCARLRQAYSVSVVRKTARKQGWRVIERRMEDGTVRVQVTEKAW